MEGLEFTLYFPREEMQEEKKKQKNKREYVIAPCAANLETRYHPGPPQSVEDVTAGGGRLTLAFLSLTKCHCQHRQPTTVTVSAGRIPLSERGRGGLAMTLIRGVWPNQIPASS